MTTHVSTTTNCSVVQNGSAAATLSPDEEKIILGFVLDTLLPIYQTLQELTRGTLILGRPGSGKSKLAQAIIRCLIFLLMITTILIDAEGDLSDDIVVDVAAKMAEEECDAILNRTHILRPDWMGVFQIDPFEPSAENLNPLQAEALLRQQVSKMSNAIIRGIGDVSLDSTPRLKRWLENILIAIGTAVGPDGKRLPLANIFILLDVNHPKFDLVYGLILPDLPPEIRQDFDTLISLRSRPQDVLGQVESTINRLRSLMQPLVQAAFTRTADAKSPGCTVNFSQLVRERSIVLINLKDTQYFSPEQADALGKIMVYMVVSSMQGVADKGERVPCALIVDEFQRFVTEDILRGLCQGRKWGLCTILITQTLNYIDLVQEGFSDIILSVVETVVCFQQRHPRDLETLVRFLYQGCLDHTEKMVEVSMHRGYNWHDVDEHSESVTKTTNWSESTGKALTNIVSSSSATTDSWGLGKAFANMLNWSDSQSTGTMESSGGSCSGGSSVGVGTSITQSPILDGTFVIGATKADGNHRSANDFDGSSQQHSSGTSASDTHSNGGGQSEVQSHSVGGARSWQHASSASRSEAAGTSHGGAISSGTSISHKKVPLANIQNEWQSQGTPRNDYNYQLEKLKSHIYSLPDRHAVVARAGHRTVTIKTPFVEDPFPNVEIRPHLIRAIEEKLRNIHSYYAKPVDLDKENEQRLDQFIGAVAPAVSTTSNPPKVTNATNKSIF